MTTGPDTVACVAAGSEPTVAGAAEVLSAGGNAFDAAVAAGCCAAVAEPCLSSLGGGGFLMARPAVGQPGSEVLVDFFVDAPGLDRASGQALPELIGVPVHFPHATQVFHVGPGSVAVPGVLAGYLYVHHRWGRLPLADVVAPAARLARAGVTVNESFAHLLTLLDGVLGRTEVGRRLFRRDDRPLRAGERFTNPELADLLDAIGAGQHAGFTAAELGPSVTAADVAHHRVVERSPLRVELAGATLVTNPAPALGGRLVQHGVALLEERWLRHGTASPDDVVDALWAIHRLHRRLEPGAVRGTTHVSVVDADGNIAAMTTSNGSGSGEFVPGTGVQLNNMMGEDDLLPLGRDAVAPGTRLGSMMSPLLLELTDGTTVALGSGGSERIRSTILQLVVALAAHGRPLAEAVLGPRVHVDGTLVQVEPGFAADVLARWHRRFTVNQWDHLDLYFGGAHAVSTRGEAVGDPRRQGAGLVIRSGTTQRS